MDDDDTIGSTRQTAGIINFVQLGKRRDALTVDTRYAASATIDNV